MKKVFYLLLLLAELVLDIMILSLLRNGTFYIAIAVTVAIWAALLILVLLKLKKAEDPAVKRKLYRRLALAMASPVVVFIILVIGFIIGLSAVI